MKKRKQEIHIFKILFPFVSFIVLPFVLKTFYFVFYWFCILTLTADSIRKTKYQEPSSADEVLTQLHTLRKYKVLIGGMLKWK